ncbi:hypothetical protein [Dyella mobilis]|uniref:Uncharacterized protein n=1 Tax=Dyella mobilis TaxID=1849582 RepID=A0ABS2KDY9_9GAMM|nr:hypothetical protein [Dyella mobilis]MBM7129375.1 hypothetical protein [Dyella mobilis]GLQ98670.1 hypothetical protein GCM10007863_30900 [Dyella mobilis]
MTDYPNIRRVLSTVFNCEDGLSLDVVKGLYVRSQVSSANAAEFRRELRDALNDPFVSWKHLLCNNDYEVFDAESEEDARRFAVEVLWEPLEVEAG